MSTTYDNKFYDYINSGAVASARHVLPVVLNKISITSVLDVGCGQGAWLTVWKELGIDSAIGVDGSYIDESKLLINKDCFFGKDLSHKIDLNQRFDLVQSLEVAEHIEKQHAKTFVANLVNHSNKYVLFSAAPKGQGGDQHVNEQPYEYWRKIFAEFDFYPIDCIRPNIKDIKQIAPWYRYNTFLYVASSELASLSAQLGIESRPQTQKLNDISPWWYQIRKLIIRALPTSIQTKIAKIKEAVVVATRDNN